MTLTRVRHPAVGTDGGRARSKDHDQRPFLLGLLALVVAVPLLLFNLYSIHDYYWAALAPIVALGIGLGAEWLLANRRGRWVRRALVGLAGAWIATIIGTFPTWSIIYGTPAEEPRRCGSPGSCGTTASRTTGSCCAGGAGTRRSCTTRGGRASPFRRPIPSSGRASTAPRISAEIDFDAILADPVFGPFIFCDRDARCELEERP